MDIILLEKEIKQTGYLENKKVGMYFHTKYPELYRKLIDTTNALDDTCWSNKYLRARFIFLTKYNLDLARISSDYGVYTFDRKTDDFVDRTGNYVMDGWNKIKTSIPNEIYGLDETINILCENDLYKNFFGKAKNRSLLKYNPILYNSIYYHTKLIDGFNKNNNKLSARIIFLVNYSADINKIKCGECQLNFTSYNYELNDYNKVCLSCFKKIKHYPSKEYFKRKYGDGWENYYNEDRKVISSYKVNSLDWFIKKHGDEVGSHEYGKYLEQRLNVLNELKSKRCSKISQELFWMIFEKLNSDEKSNCFFRELNKERLIKVDNLKYYFPDFILNNKIIEYDGMYWHDKKNDNIRNDFYAKNGYKLLTINEVEFNRSKKDPSVINKCLTFLRDET